MNVSQSRIVFCLFLLINSAVLGCSVMSDAVMPFTTDAVTIILALFFQLILLITVYTGGPLGLIFSGTVFLFFVVRITVLQFYPDHYTYVLYSPLTPAALRRAVILLVALGTPAAIAISLGRGAVNAFQRSKKPLTLFPFPKRGSTGRRFFISICCLLVLVKSTALLLFFKVGVGLPVPVFNFPIEALRLAKAINILSFLMYIPITGFVVGQLRGRVYWFSLMAVTMFVVSLVPTLSKAMLISAFVPFVLVYFASGKSLPRWLIILTTTASIVTIVFGAIYLSKIRIDAASSYIGTGQVENNAGTLSYSIMPAALGFLNRLGCDFDVLVAVSAHERLFRPHLDFAAEVIDVLNGYVRFIDVNPPRWSQLLPHLLHGSELRYLLRAQVGENIGLFPHIFLNFGAWMGGVVSFVVLFSLSMLYFASRSVFVRLVILFEIFGNVPEGSGMLTFLAIPQRIAIVWILYNLISLLEIPKIKRPTSVKKTPVVV